MQPSRPRTPSSAVHRLLRPSLSSKSSVSSLHTAAQPITATAIPSAEQNDLLSPHVISSASSVSNGIVADLSAVNMSESEQGDSEDATVAEGQIVLNEEAQQQLRETLRRTLSRKAPGICVCPCHSRILTRNSVPKREKYLCGAHHSPRGSGFVDCTEL
jgi:hypothetical protein